MPIFDNDGTTNSIWKQAYDNDGALNNEWKERYDYDGTRNTRIFSNNETFSPNAPISYMSGAYTSGSTGGSSSYTGFMWTYTISAAKQYYSTCFYYIIPINCSNWSSIDITYASSLTNLRIGVSDNLATANATIVTGTSVKMWDTSKWSRSVSCSATGSGYNPGTSKTVTLNLSGVSGYKYLMVYANIGQSTVPEGNGQVIKLDSFTFKK